MEEISRINGAGAEKASTSSGLEEVAYLLVAVAACLAGLWDWFLLIDAVLGAPSPRGAKANSDPAASQAAFQGSTQEMAGCCQMLRAGPVALHPVR